MTEEDTYKALMKPTWHEMRALWLAAVSTSAPDDTTNFFAEHGWKYSDYIEAYNVHMRHYLD